MSATVAPELHYTYTTDENLDLWIHGVKANHECKTERKTFNLCRANILGKHIDSNFCLEKASNVVNCFQKLRKDDRPGCKEKYDKVFECTKKYNGKLISFGGCQSVLDEYLAC